MLSYIIKLATLIIFGSFTVFSYYKFFPFHVEVFPAGIITTYFIPLIIFYSIYKILSYLVFNSDKKDEIEISYTSILLYGLLHLLLLCMVYFGMKEGFSGTQGIGLFIKVLGFLLLPLIIFTASYGLGNKALSYIKGFEHEEGIFRFLSSLGVGFFSFIALIFILAFIGFYNIYGVLIVIALFIGLGYKNIIHLYINFFKTKIILKKDISLYTSEFLYVIVTALISANLILVFRPFPIGWDDLGVYMNYPNLLASAGKLISLGGLQTWELYTGIGYIFGSATQAFYLNTFSGFLASIIIYLFAKSFFNEKNEFINIPLLLVTIFLSMPMVIFQLAKDMKLDVGLFSISLIAIYMVYYIFIKKEELLGEDKYAYEEKSNSLSGKFHSFLDKVFKNEFFKKEDFYYMFVIGIIAGFAFAIKMTSLMLISAIIGVIIFCRIGYFAFLGYFAIYFAVFTKLKLWDMMNVVYPKNDVVFINTFSIASLLVGIGLLAYSYTKHNKEYVLKTIQIIGIFILGLIVSLTPWFAKNISETGISNISISTLISGKADYYNLDYNKILSEDKVKEKEKEIASRQNLDENGQAINADMGRYFGYEKGINNYLKLPYSLSMQINQRGEYTDITYIFFALLPVLFLFIPLRKNWYYIGVYSIILFEVFYFIFPGTTSLLTGVFNNFELPLGYAIIFGLYALILLHFKKTSDWKKDKMLKLFIINLTFTVFYVFLWNISAYGIVWYGISMYILFLLFIGIGIHYITRENKEIDSDDNMYILKTISFFAVFIIISIYFVKSSVPHIFANFNEDSYMHYKSGVLKEKEAIFAYHGDYLNILFELNIKEDKKIEFIKNYKKTIYEFFALNSFPDEFKTAVEQINDINKLNDLLNFFVYNPEISKNMNPVTYTKMKQRLDEIRMNMFKNLVSPVPELKSEAIIYRMGTFLRYFITENNNRLVEDSLIFIFDDYIYNKDINKTIDNFKKLGINYIVVDLNTPTIDKDPTHALTNRFENLLKTFTSERLKMIDSDSLCLKTAIDLYNKTNKTSQDLDNYIRLAGVNFESYDEKNKEIGRTAKLIKCYDVMFYLFDNNLVTNNNFPYLAQLNEEYKKQKFASSDDKYKYMLGKIPAGFKAVFKIEK